MTWATGVSSEVWKRQSRRVRMPTTLSPSTMGSPEMLWWDMISRASRIVASGCRVTGSWMTPFAERLTLSTSRIWSAIGRFLWMTPMPPSRARATASFHSVTVSMAAEATGTEIGTFREKRVLSSTSLGRNSERQGTRRTSSKVRASRIRSRFALIRLEFSGCRWKPPILPSAPAHAPLERR